MFGSSFYNGVLRKYVIYFGTLFNNIEIDRIDSSGNTLQTLRVPISYGPKEKYLARFNVDPNLDRKVAIQLPRMSFEITGYRYDSTRRLNPLKKNYAVSTESDNKLRGLGTPTPYDIDFELAIFVRNAEDGLRVIEQILPYFTPEFTATIKPIDSMPDYKVDIPLVLNSMSTTDTYEGDYETRRALVHTLSFTMKGYVYGPVRDKTGIIKLANTQFFVDETGTWTSNTVASKVVVYPGLTSNGEATSNSSLTVDKDQINETDDYGYIIEKTFND